MKDPVVLLMSLPQEHALVLAESGLLRRCYRGGITGNCAGTGCSVTWDYYIRRRSFFFLHRSARPALARMW